MNNINVFVYGTLLQGERNFGVVARYIMGESVPGVIFGKMYSYRQSYPAVVLDENEDSRIVGEWISVTPDGLKAMDRLEGYSGPGKDNYYDRVLVTDIENGCTGWVYVWASSEGSPEITSGSWRERSLITS